MWKSFLVLAFLVTACGSSAPPPSESPSATSSSTPPPSSSAEPSSGAGCKDKDGKVHAVGEQWNDGCNECSCGPNGAKCTRRACN